ncbi:dicarboxylate transporter/tellurite-resistance protein TehA [Rhizobium sp. TRM95796]|uniref:dicarboxylate transporter/tellurite-resistance protein TehA n=1 Tax=Rhizobium sp. TRM95796 TaxID=2979862 RepID=UPI0021E8AC95|nr:dicarboxylate transporter/tellurite-resistance protein TehA [Rhizobium sp. TRM95796]MCV3768822.1 dicarboxylate transporter/tellurite-resistance protein TehA [Rhizobium sp. TRM95796]
MNLIPALDAETTQKPTAFPRVIVPAAAFGIVLGLAGLANAWRVAEGLWHIAPIASRCISILATAIWALLLIAYGCKWIFQREKALLEIEHPIQCCFVGLIGISAMLIGGLCLPYFPAAAQILFWLGALWTVVFAVWRTGGLWTGGREPTATTAVLYLPTVAGSYVVAIIGVPLGYPDVARLAFGAGFFSWLAIESVLLNRLLTAPGLAEPLRPTIGIQLAPPAVGSVAYLSITSGAPDLLVHAMFGYALLQLLLLFRTLPWVLKQAFSASYWAYSFGLTALATAALRMAERGETGIVTQLATPAFILANAAIGVLAYLSFVALIRGKLFSR